MLYAYSLAYKCAQPDDPSRITLSFHRKKRYSTRTRVCKTRRLTDWLLIRRRRTSIDDHFHVKGERLRSRGYIRQISIRRIYSYAWRPDLSHKAWRSLRIIISTRGKKASCCEIDDVIWEAVIYWACRSTEQTAIRPYDLAIHLREHQGVRPYRVESARTPHNPRLGVY